MSKHTTFGSLSCANIRQAWSLLYRILIWNLGHVKLDCTPQLSLQDIHYRLCLFLLLPTFHSGPPTWLELGVHNLGFHASQVSRRLARTVGRERNGDVIQLGSQLCGLLLYVLGVRYWWLWVFVNRLVSNQEGSFSWRVGKETRHIWKDVVVF
jgi:hypothetical protein